MRVWVGIDDTDSREGMCTTYLATILIEEIERSVGKILGFPRIIRLNPTIPYKTRGNGAVSFLVEVDDEGKREELIEIVNDGIVEYAMLEDERTNPGAVFVDEDLAVKLRGFGEKAIKDVISIDEALFVIGKFFIPHLKFKKGRGLIGALAAVGVELNDFTLELLAYRHPERFGTEREYDEESFFDADYLLYPKLFDTVDWCNESVVAVPNTPCPVLFGLRGEDVEVLHKAMSIVKTEEIDRYQIFVTNHATDMHLIELNSSINSGSNSGVGKNGLRNYRSYRVKGIVVTEPYDIEGGHVFFEIETDYGIIKCAAFEPTKQFRNIVRELRNGDVVEVYGSMKRDTINLEKMKVERLAEVYVEQNPVCPKCGKRMESAGKGKGFRCRKCKTIKHEKERKRIERRLEEGYYEVPPSARRHLSKPLIRMMNGARGRGDLDASDVKFHVFR